MRTPVLCLFCDVPNIRRVWGCVGIGTDADPLAFAENGLREDVPDEVFRYAGLPGGRNRIPQIGCSRTQIAYGGIGAQQGV